MKTMKTLVKRFNRLFGNSFYEAVLDTFDSYPGHYVVCITGPFGITNAYSFATAREFREWMDGVVLD